MFRLCFWKGKELSHCLNRKYFRTSRLKSRKMTDIFSHTPTAILQYCMIAFHVWIIMNFPNVTHYPFFWLASYFTRHSAAKWLSCNCDFEMFKLDQAVTNMTAKDKYSEKLSRIKKFSQTDLIINTLLS